MQSTGFKGEFSSQVVSKNGIVLRFALHLSKFNLRRPGGQDQMPKTSSLMVRLDEQSKTMLTAAAELRRISVSDYVRSVVVGQAERELAAAESHTIAMTPDEQLEFWNALSKPPKLTKAQKDLGAMMRGDS